MKKDRSINNFDWALFVILILLIFIGWINIYAATFNPDSASMFNLSNRAGRQFLWIIIGILLFLGFLIIDSKFYAFIAYPLYGLSLLILVAVFLFGKEVNGARSWVDIGFLQVQPAEFTKITTALVLAKFMGRHEFSMAKIKHFIVIGAMIIFPVALILVQNDTGSALVFFSLVLMLYRQGMKPIFLIVLSLFVVLFFLVLIFPKFIILLVFLLLFLLAYLLFERKKKNVYVVLPVFAGWFLVFCLIYFFNKKELSDNLFIILFYSIMASLTVLTIVVAVKRLYYLFPFLGILFVTVSFIYIVDFTFYKVLEPHQQKRISILLGLESDPKGAGYNVNQSIISIGSGGFFGKGYLQGTQTKYDFVPEQSTDFIFCTIGEEWGFVGSFIFISIFVLLLWQMLIIAERQRSRFSRVYAYSVVSIFMFHFMLNVGMTLGLMPVIGIPLPFISYGGSSLWTFMLLIALMLRLDMNRNEIIR